MHDVVQEFADLVAQGEGHLTANLDRALFLIAATAQPTLNVDHQVQRIDDLATQAPSSSPRDLAEWLFSQGRFVGNTTDYYAPENSYLNRVLDLGRGIPITLSALFIEVGRRHKMAIEPIGMPGHFITQIAPGTYVDPFGGESMDRDGCERLFQRLAGRQVGLPTGSLTHTSRLALVQRVILNLRGIGHQRNDAQLTEMAIRLRAALPSPRPGELLELAHLLAGKSDWGRAAALAETVAASLPPERAASVQQQAIKWRARLN